ncbi:MAG TPA: hypothetical protein PLM74_06370, partial [Bacillota bacterium]|nr:hypothetical protein [Bacillota bacterium]
AAILAGPASALELPYPPNARLMAMGWTFVGVVDQHDPGRSNPGAYGFNSDQITLSLGAGFGAGLDAFSTVYAGVSDLDRGVGGGGLALVYSKAEEGEHDLKYATYGIGRKVADWCSLGLSLAYAQQSDSERAALTTDTGLLLKIGTLSAGVQASSITTSLVGGGVKMETEFTPEISVGLAFAPSKALTVAVDAHGVVKHDDGAQPWYSGGAEVWLRDKLALRVGAFGSFAEGAADLSYTGGVGIKMGKAEVGYALVWSDGGLRAQCFTASSSF